MISPPSKSTCVLIIGLALLAGGLGVNRRHRALNHVVEAIVEPANFDFGKSRQGQTLTQRFCLKNNGRVPIKVTKVESSCSCTTTDGLSDRVVAAGQNLEFPVTI